MGDQKMPSLVTLAVISYLFSVSSAATWDLIFYGSFYQCLSYHSPYPTQVHQLLYSWYSPSYQPILQSSIQNLRFNSTTIPKPRYIITPYSSGHVQAAVICSKRHGLQVRVRSGGHDYEGLSYKADSTFVLLDLFNLQKVKIDSENETAWVQAGATTGELYYQIANETGRFGFPASVCPSVGVGGQIIGGGQGTMMRKFGLAADNVVDAILVDANGEIKDRKSMGEDLFWAIRGGGGASFGVIVEYKINLVPIPPKVTVFTVPRTLQQGATQMIYRWQQVAARLPKDLFIRIIITVGEEADGRRTIKALFNSLYLGSIDQLIALMDSSFPELGLEAENCKEMTWIESILFFNENTGQPTNILMDRNNYTKGFFTAKSDFVTMPITKRGLEAIWKVMQEGEAGIMIWDPYGGKMSEISQSETPFPHRAGTLYNIQYYSKWQDGGAETERKRVDWINKLYNFMTPYVSNNPRAAYLNYRDLSLGMNKKYGNVNYQDAKIWGEKYFKDNFERLARVKGTVDPMNYFRNEQSIPPYVASL